MTTPHTSTVPLPAASLRDTPAAAERPEDGALGYARAVIADVADFEDTDIAAACAVIEAQSDDPEERARARDLRALVEGEAA